MSVVLISLYELGRQPFGLGSAAAWLRSCGQEVRCLDLATEQLSDEALRSATLVAFHLPMHTATRLAVGAIETARRLNPEAHLCCFGLYAPLNAEYLRQLGVQSVFGGEFEPALVRLAQDLGDGRVPRPEPLISLERLRFKVPDRSDLPPAAEYAKLRVNGSARLAGYTEASRGCKHLCRHCPVVPVYNGAFRVVQREVVLEDIRRQVAAGVRHITFGDPDFFNGPGHAARLVEAFAREFPDVTYDATIKIEHLLKHGEMLPVLKDTGCLFVTSAVESVEDEVLRKLDKGHTRADFVEVAERLRGIGLAMAPTFIAFTPWTTVEGYRDLLAVLRELELVENVSPVQLALRLLIPSGSRLMELEDIQDVVTAFDQPALLHRWRHRDPEVDELAAAALNLAAKKGTRREQFARFWELAYKERMPDETGLVPRAAIPYMDEPWYC